MKILVTGGAGFIGSWIVDHFIENGDVVVIIDNLSTGKTENINQKAVFYETNISDSTITEIFQKEKPEIVFHLAAQINVRESIKNPSKDAKTNILGSLNIIQNCANHHVKKIIFSSTGGAIYGDQVTIPTPETEKEDPTSPYGIAKLTIEKYLQFYQMVQGLDFVALRYSNVYGPRQNNQGEAGVITIFINNILNKKESTIFGNGTQTRDYIYVKDIVKANVLALELNGVYNVGTSLETELNTLYKKIQHPSNSTITAHHGKAIPGELQRSCLDSTKISKQGWKKQYDLEKGIQETYDYFKTKSMRKN